MTLYSILFAVGLGLLLLVKGQILPENIVREIREHRGMSFTCYL